MKERNRKKQTFLNLFIVTLAIGLLTGLGSCSKETGEEISVTQISVTAGTSNLVIDQNLRLTVTIAPTNIPNREVIWSSSDNTIATVDETGLVTGISPGTVTITATSQQNAAIRDFITLEIVPFSTSVTGISVETPSNSPEIDDMLQLTATVAPENATNKQLIWSSSNEAVATVDQTGLVNCIALGEVNITATAQENPSIRNIVALRVFGTKSILSFTIRGMESVQPTVIGTDITFEVDFNKEGRGLDVAALVPTIVHDGAFVDPPSNTANDFTGGPAFYTVTAEDNEVKQYRVSVRIKSGTTFITTWDAQSIRIPTNPELSYNYNIDLDGDGFVDQSGISGDLIANFNTDEEHTIRITGNFPAIFMLISNSLEREDLTAVEQWGTVEWLSMEAAFPFCDNLEITATDIPNLSSVANMSRMFQLCDIVNPDVSQWDTSKVTNMSLMFSGTGSADPDVSQWNTSRVTNMESMFSGATAANPDVSNWDTSEVTNMGSMFLSSNANPDVSQWDTSEVTNMSGMFAGTTNANPDVSQWDTSSLQDVGDMFSSATRANPDLSNWIISQWNDARNIFSGSGISLENYENALIRFEEHRRSNNNLTLPSNINIDVVPVEACSGDATLAKSRLESEGWSFREDLFNEFNCP